MEDNIKSRVIGGFFVRPNRAENTRRVRKRKRERQKETETETCKRTVRDRQTGKDRQSDTGRETDRQTDKEQKTPRGPGSFYAPRYKLYRQEVNPADKIERERNIPFHYANDNV